jgi:hyaluronan synthase/N-acetylglucosaminyltransferase
MWRDLVLLLAMLLVSSVFVLAHGASVEFLLLHGALHVTLLIPVRVYALLTLASTRWETR